MITRYLISVSEKFGENIGQTTNLTKHTDAEYGIPIFTQKIIHKHRQKSMHGYILIMRYQFLGDGYMANIRQNASRLTCKIRHPLVLSRQAIFLSCWKQSLKGMIYYPEQ